ncbi:conserved membrane hypothetical protein [Flavobacterium sp. 9AF]|uniref:potassium transporter KefB n=1 Tax=Flavobacterium sp. 9AF TaxID=2653142 RepID=UPI0012F164CE|nr:potassium transporter KefB [Flavobacterium sp. 9AF]VXB69264.1 conserved membrane hypothetical protein [Flavobacterium sp. 9AF]
MHKIEIYNVLKFAIAGAILALVLISILIFSVPNPNPEWGKMWFIKPLIITPFITSIGGSLFYIINAKKRTSKILNFILFMISIFVLLFFLWIGTILGLDGTLWN